MQTGIISVYLTRSNMLDKGTFSPSVKYCWGAHGLSFHRQMLQIQYKREIQDCIFQTQKILYFNRQNQRAVGKKKRKRQSPGSVWPGKGQEVKWLTQSSPEQEIQLGLSKLLELNFKLCNFLLWRAFRRRISTFQRGKIGKPLSFSEPVFVCETNTKTLWVSTFLPTVALREEEDFSGTVFFPVKCVSGWGRKL